MKKRTQALVAVGIIGAMALLLTTRKKKTPAEVVEDQEVEESGVHGEYRGWNYTIRVLEGETHTVWGVWINEHVVLKDFATEDLPIQFYGGFGKTKNEAAGVARKAIDDRIPVKLKEDLLPS